MASSTRSSCGDPRGARSVWCGSAGDHRSRLACAHRRSIARSLRTPADRRRGCRPAHVRWRPAAPSKRRERASRRGRRSPQRAPRQIYEDSPHQATTSRPVGIDDEDLALQREPVHVGLSHQSRNEGAPQQGPAQEGRTTDQSPRGRSREVVFAEIHQCDQRPLLPMGPCVVGNRENQRRPADSDSCLERISSMFLKNIHQ